jgi:hypothetical protein
MFGRKKLEPAYDVAALRSELESLCERARNAGLRHYVIEGVLQDAATAVRSRHAATAPL